MEEIKLMTEQTKKVNTKIAKNVILFVGDGMSLNTVTAANLYKAKIVDGDNDAPESHHLTFQRLDNVAFSKARIKC